MTDGKTRTIRRWNDLRIGENPIRARRRSNHPHKKASLALAIPFHGALSAREGGKPFGVALCGHAWQNQPLVVTDLARDPRFAESPFLINMNFAFTRSAAAWSQRV